MENLTFLKSKYQSNFSARRDFQHVGTDVKGILRTDTVCMALRKPTACEARPKYGLLMTMTPFWHILNHPKGTVSRLEASFLAHRGPQIRGLESAPVYFPGSCCRSHVRRSNFETPAQPAQERLGSFSTSDFNHNTHGQPDYLRHLQTLRCRFWRNPTLRCSI
jgi:hypothetical protein